jgi:zinc protease
VHATLLIVAAVVAAGSFALPARVADAQQTTAVEPVTTVEGISEYRLDNGLKVLLFPDPSKPTFTVNVTYLVGSRHEGRGEKGMAHLLEHMMFRGTDTYDNVWGLLEEHGARIGWQANGTTWLDRTNYYETLPATEENLRWALEMEADRMVNSRVSAEDLEAEMTVVRNEFEMGESNPFMALSTRIEAAAFEWHPYGNSTIGNRSDIERVPVEKLRAFYETYYQPDNAMLVVAGKFEPELALELIQETFGAIPRPDRQLDETYTVEPTQDGPRFVTVKRVGDLAMAGALYHVPAGSHPDFPAVQILEDVLVSEPAGRLYKALVEPGTAASVSGFSFPFREPGIIEVFAEVRLDQDVEQVLDQMLGVTEGLAGAPITEEEVERAKTRRLKNIKLAMNDSGRIGVRLSEWEALGDWRMHFIYRDRVKEVTAADVQRVAETYLIENNRTAGIFIPTKEPVRAEIPPIPDVAAMVAGYEGGEAVELGEAFEATPENIETRTTRETLDSGIKVALLPKKTRGGAVRAQFRFRFGTEGALTGHQAALEMVPSMLMRGTRRLDHQALRDEIDTIQSRINVWGGAGACGAAIESDREHIMVAVELLTEILREPAFDAEQFEILKNERLAELEESLSDPQALGRVAIGRAVSPWPAESIHYVPTIPEQIARLEAVTLDDVKTMYEKFYGASNAQISFVGGFDADEIKQAITTSFGDWKSPSPYERIIQPYKPVDATAQVIDTPDKPNGMIAMITTFEMRDDDPDYPTMEFASFILGRSASSRLMNRLRQQEGFSYWTGGFLTASSRVPRATQSGVAICAAQNADRALVAMQEEFDLWLAEGLTGEELTEGKQSYALVFQNGLSNDGQVAGMLVNDLDLDRTMQYRIDLLAGIEKVTNDDVKRVLDKHLGDAKFAKINASDRAAATAAVVEEGQETSQADGGGE